MRSLCENSCLFFKEFLFHIPIEKKDGIILTKEQRTFVGYLVDILLELILFVNQSKRLWGFWNG
jgi:hypothetical protein